VADNDGRAIQVIEKPRHPRSRLKGVGVYLFAPQIFDAIRRTPRTAMRDEYEITDSIQIFINDGYHVFPCECIDKDVNVTFPGDLLDLNLRLLEKSGRGSLVAESAEVAADASIEDTIVGADAKVGAGAWLRRSVVFAGATVPDGASLDRAIVTETGILSVTGAVTDATVRAT